MSQMVEIVSEPSPTKNLGESSDTQAHHAHFCPNFQPIYHEDPKKTDIAIEMLSAAANGEKELADIFTRMIAAELQEIHSQKTVPASS
jgi:hypothetical protein